MRGELENSVHSETGTFAGRSRCAPLPRGRAPCGLRAAGDIALRAAGGARRVVAEGPQRVGAVQASMLRVFLCLAGHN